MATATLNLPVTAATLPDGSASNNAPGMSRRKGSEAAPAKFYMTADFDPAQRESLFWTFVVPQDYSSAPVVRLFWQANATSGSVVWGAQVAAVTPADPDTLTEHVPATATTATTAANTTEARRIVSTVITLASVDSLAAGDTVVLCVYRDATNGSDTCAVDAELIGGSFEYVTTATGTTTPPPDPGPPPSGTLTVGSSNTTQRVAAPTAPATMTVAQLVTAGGNITGATVIRGGTWSSGQINITGSDVVLTGITFTSTAQDVIKIGGTAARVRIYANTFTGAGSSGDAGSTGIIKIMPDPSVSDNATTQRVTINRQVTIDENTVTNPKDAFVWQNHGNRGIRISHNTISGTPWRFDGTETEIMKFGWNDGDTDTGAENMLAFNTITGYEGRPYTIGFKQSDWLVVGNQVSRRVELRACDRIRFVGNVLADGDLHGGGNGHTFKRNFIRCAVDHDGFGPVSVYMTNGFNVYSGQPAGVPFYKTETNSTWQENTIVNDAGSNGFGVILFHSQYGDATARPSGNTFTGNLLVTRGGGSVGAGVGLRINNDSQSLSAAIAANSWSGNSMYGVTIGQVPGTVLGSDPGTPIPTTRVFDAADLVPLGS